MDLFFVFILFYIQDVLTFIIKYKISFYWDMSNNSKFSPNKDVSKVWIQNPFYWLDPGSHCVNHCGYLVWQLKSKIITYKSFWECLLEWLKYFNNQMISPIKKKKKRRRLFWEAIFSNWTYYLMFLH